VAIERIEQTGAGVRIWATPRAHQATCPACDRPSAKVHSRYVRHLADAAIAGQPATIHLQVRRFFCHDPTCSTRTFAEQLAGLTTPYARRSPLAQRLLEQVALALAGRAGARLAGALGLAASRSTLLRLLRALPDPALDPVAVLGVDDFAIRRGHHYGTVLVNMATHRPIELLPDRDAASFAAWLEAHPGTKVICRDRAGAYAEGAKQAAPAALQVADRWHLWHNLAGYVEKTVARHRGCLHADSDDQHDATHDATIEPAAGQQQPTAADAEQQAALARAAVQATQFEQRALVARTRERYAAVQALRAQNKGIKPIMRELGLAKETVRRFYRAHSAEELLAKARDGRGQLLEPYQPYLHQRLADGTTNASQLFRELRTQGYHGSQGTVIAYLRPFRTDRRRTTTGPTTRRLATPPRPPKVRQVVGWILTHPDHLGADEQLRLKQVLATCPHLDATAHHVAGFAELLTGVHVDHLDDWITAVEADDLPALHSFSAGLKRDHEAVRNGLRLPYSSGAVEGNVNRIKMLKRQMYGRANLDLLRKRVLLRS